MVPNTERSQVACIVGNTTRWLTTIQTEIHVLLDTCAPVAQKIVHARPLHSAVSNADWSDAGKRRTRLQILHLPKRTRSILKCSICIRILLSSAMPSLSSSVSAAMIVVRQGGPCGRGTEFVDIEFIVLLCRTCGGTRPWNS